MANDVRKIQVVRPSSFSPMPSPRSGHRCVADERNLYLFGGFSPYHEEKIFCELWRYNIATGTWSLLNTTGPAPSEVCSSCVLLDKDCIITYGGSGVPFGLSNSNKLHVFLIKERRWVLIEANTSRDANNDDDEVHNDDGHDQGDLELMYQPQWDLFIAINRGRAADLPIAGYGQSMVLSPEKELYIFAGTAGREFFSSLTHFQFSTRKWTLIRQTRSPFIIPRYRHEAVTYDDYFYVIGGGTGGINPGDVCELEEIPQFCFSTKKWALKKCEASDADGFPKKRRCHGCVLFQDKVYICGGFDGNEIFDDIWTLDMRTFKWAKYPKVLPYPVYFHSTAVTPSGCMLTFGGIKSLDPVNDPRSNDLSCLWLTIPPLLDLSLSIVYSCIQNVDSITPEELLEIGIPEHLIPPSNTPISSHGVPQCG